MHCLSFSFGRSWRAVYVAAGLGAAASACALVTVGDPAVQGQAPTPVSADPGWNTVGDGVYIGQGWMLTAGHVNFGGGATVAGQFYEAYLGSNIRLRALDGSGDTDLQMYRLKWLPPATVKAAPLIDQPLPLGQEVTMIGFGYRRGAALTFDAQWVAGGTPVKYHGFAWGGIGNKTWGTTRITGVTDYDDTYGMARVYTAIFTAPGPGSTPTAAEALIAPGDSGGAMFAQVGEEWRLAGILIDLGVLEGQGWANAIYGDWTYAVDLSAYRPQIDALRALPTPYEFWQYKNFRGTASGATADPDGDGFTNLEEYAYGLDPKAKNPPSAAPQVGLVSYADGRALTATFTRYNFAYDTLVVVEVSDDLVTWRSGAGVTTTLTPVEPHTPVQTFVVRDATPSTGQTRRFMRVRVAR